MFVTLPTCTCQKTSESYEQFSFSFSDNKVLEFYWEKDIKKPKLQYLKTI